MAFEMRSDEGLVGSPPPGMVIRDQLVSFTSSEDLAFLPDECELRA
jgi:hypothetical protein